MFLKIIFNNFFSLGFNYFEIKGTLDHETREEFLIDPKFKDYNVDSYRYSLSNNGKELNSKFLLLELN